MKTPTIVRESFNTPTTEEWLKLRSKDITSTDAAALFGLSPYITPFELWHRKKKGDVVEIEPNERMKWGTRLQDSIALGIAEDQKWEVQRRPGYERLPELRVGASFDFTILAGDGGNGLLEIKNVDPLALRDGWLVEDEEVEAPPHIEMQVQHQLLVSGLPYAYIGALIGGNRTVVIRREPAPEIIQSIVTRAEDFWASIDANKAPKPDFSKDSKFIAKLYRDVRQGKVTNVEKDAEITSMIEAYRKHKTAIEEAESAREEIKARILTKLGDTEKAVGKGFSISMGSVKESRVEAYDRAGFRMFRVNVSKSK